MSRPPHTLIARQRRRIARLIDRSITATDEGERRRIAAMLETAQQSLTRALETKK